MSHGPEREQPDSPGLWRFTGTVYARTDPNSTSYVMEIEIDDWLFNIVRSKGSLVIVDHESGEELGGDWKGRWVKVASE